MTKHETVHALVRIQKAFMVIKTLSNSAEIDRLCVQGVADIVAVGDSLHPDLLFEFNRKHADFMA